MNNWVYLDNNSTTKTDEKVVEAMIPYFNEFYANPASFHNFGADVKKRIDAARNEVADLINAGGGEIVFTSGATEAINLAIKGVAFSSINSRKRLVTIRTEHKAVLDTCDFLERRGFDVCYLPVNEKGLVDFESFKNAVDERTLLVSVMLVNNETGVIQDVSRLADYSKDQGAYFLCDATQAAGKIPLDISDLDVDMLCFSGHKFHGPKGIGVLYISNQSGLIKKLEPQQHGGGHEFFLRSGTVNVPATIGLAKACEIARSEMASNLVYIGRLRDSLENNLLEIKGSFINGSVEQRIYNTSNICFPGQDANVLIGMMRNIALSNGSACTSFVVKPSHVLTAMGLDAEDAFSSIRFSLGKFNTASEVEIAISELKKIIQQI